MRTQLPRHLHESGCRVDLPGGPDRGEDVRLKKGGFDPVHVVGDLAEPDDVWPGFGRGA